MSYEPTNWKAGDTVTSAKLNKLEQGVASNVLVVNMIVDTDTGVITLGKTWQEIFDADFAIAILTNPTKDMQEHKEYVPINNISSYLDGTYSIMIEGTQFIADSADDYPISNHDK